MKAINVSTDVFARIWALRADGEENENAILQRLLFTDLSPSKMHAKSASVVTSRGLWDKRHNVFFPEGFEIERTYKGIDYRAIIVDKMWVIEGVSGSYNSLNKLSNAIGTKTENAWANWYFRAEDGSRQAVSKLRNPTKVAKKIKTIITKNTSPDISSLKELSNNSSWLEILTVVFYRIGGRGSYSQIYYETENVCGHIGRELTDAWQATIRRTIEDHSSDSENFRGNDVFFSIDGKGSGNWGLRDFSRVRTH